MNNEFNNINPSSNVTNQVNNYPYGHSNTGGVQNYQQQPVINATPQYNGNVQQSQPVIQAGSTYPQQTQVQLVQQTSYAQPTPGVVAATPSYQQQSNGVSNTQVTYPQVSSVQSVSYTQTVTPTIQANPTYPQQAQVGLAQQTSYAQPSQPPVITASSQMPQNIQTVAPQTQNIVVQSPVQTQPQTTFNSITPVIPQDFNMTSVNDFQAGQLPVSSSNIMTDTNTPSIFIDNDQLPVQYSNNTEVNPPKKSLKDKIFKSKKIIPLMIVLVIVILAIVFGINKLLSGSFGHGYSVDEGNKININETTSSKNKYKFSVDIIDVKDISIAKTKYKGYKLAITNTGSGKLKLDGFDIEFTIKNKDGEITSTTVFLSNSYMSLAPDSYDTDLLPLEVPHGKTVEGYIYFKTAIEDIETFEINVYRNVSGKKASYKINFKQPDEEEPDEESEENEELDEDEESQEDEDITSNESDVPVSTDKNNEESNSSSSKVDDKKETDNKVDTKKKNTE